MRRIRNFVRRIRLEFTPFGYIRNFVIFPIKGVLRTLKISIFSKPYDKIEKIKNIHYGERCFIIATGPSLEINDIIKLKNEKTIGINTIFKLFTKTDWRPSYYVMTDPTLHRNLYRQNDLDINSFAEKYCILNALNKDIIQGEKIIMVNCCWLDHIYHYGKSEKFRYNPNLLFGVYDYYSVTQECIVYAMYMGFKEIYLLGVDNDYTGKHQHFESTQGEANIEYEKAKVMQKMNDIGYEYIKLIANQKGVKIFNATRGGKLEVFRRVDLDMILNDADCRESSHEIREN